MPRVIHFEIPAEDPQRAIKFYTDVFGWKINQWGEHEYWLVTTGDKETPGIDGGLNKKGDAEEFNRMVNTIDVPSVDEYLAKITDNGGTVLRPKMPIPTVGYLAYCKDPEG